jgi:dTMP kinase
VIICLEGLDACGKGTHAALLGKRLGAKVWKFPDRATPTGKLIYEHLEGRWTTWTSTRLAGTDTVITNGNTRDALVFQALQLANRMEVATDIFKAAASGNAVFDRYWPSGYAYGKADGIDGDYLVNLHCWLPQPDLFILMDIDVADSAARRPDRRDRYERDGEKLTQVVANYRELWTTRALAEPLRWRVVDARGDKEATALQVQAAVAAYREAR